MTISKFKISNKVLSVLLCLAMLLSYLPFSSLTVFAEDTPAEAPEIQKIIDAPNLVYSSYKDEKVGVIVNEKEGYTYSYQWYGNCQKQDPIVGETSNTYTLPNDLARGKHSFFCLVTATRNDNGLSAETEVEVGIYVDGADSSIAKAPEAKTDLRFNGEWQELVTPGTANGGSVWYLVTTQEIAQSDINNYIFSSAIPEAANVGTYYVWYKAKGDSNHKDAKAENYVTVNIGKAQIEKPAENNTEFIYNGQEQSYFQTDTSGDSETDPVNPFEPVEPEGDEEEKEPVNPVNPVEPNEDEENKEPFDPETNEDEANGRDEYTSSGTLPAPGAPTDPVVTFDPYPYNIIGNTQTQVGTYTVTVSLKDKNSCEWADGTTDDLFYTFVIKPGNTDITGTVAIGAMVGSVTMEAEYTGNETVTYQWYCDGEVISGATDSFYTPSYDDIGKVFKVVVSGTGNYSGSVTAEYVHSKDLTQAVLSLSNTELIYNGQAQRPAVTVTYAGKVLKEGIDYKVLTWHESQWGREMNNGISVKFFGLPVDSINADKYYVQVQGIGDFESANSAPYTIKKADQNAPAVQSTNETISGKKDGSITAVDSTMEYRKKGDSTYTAISGNKLENLAAGKYYVRVRGDSNHNHSPDTEVTIAAGRKLAVTLPQNQIGYTLTVDKNALDWQGQVTITFALADGYSKSGTDFAVKVNGAAITLDENGKYIVTGAETDLTITVAGVVDETAPEAEISITTNKWTEFLKAITFGLFFRETQDVTVTAIDKGSGVDKIYYYISEDVLTEAEAKELTADKWTEYDADNKPSIDPDKKCVVYVKATDKAQNVKFISSTGLVFDGTAPALVGIENGGIYYGDKIFKAIDDNFLKIEVDGMDITDTTQGDDEYKIVADNAGHTVTDKAGNVITYTITVYKNYTVTYKDGQTMLSTETVGHGKDASLPAVPTKTGYSGVWNGDGKNIIADTEICLVYTANAYTVSFDVNGGAAIDPITVAYAEKYGKLPSSAITGLSGGDSNWYLVNENGTVTDTKITRLSTVLQARNHTLFVKRKVLAPAVSIALTVPGGISDGYQYYIPGASQRVLTATVGNMNTEILDYTYQWYKNGKPIEGATSSVLTLNGNVSDSATYKVDVTATLKDGVSIVVTDASASAQKEKKVTILHAANTLNYDANGGQGGPSGSYTGGSQLNVSNDEPTKEHHIFNGWNTKADGSGDSYKGGIVYTFADDNGNGGCKITLYAQWKLVEYKVIYKADGEEVATVTVEHGKDAEAPAIPEKTGYNQTAPVWDKDGKNITADTEINAVYTINEYTVTFMDENGVYKTVTVKHGEEIEMPEVPTKDGYTVTWEKEIDTVTADVTVKAVYTKIPSADSTSPQTGDNSSLWLWAALMFISGCATIALTVYDRKKRTAQK